MHLLNKRKKEEKKPCSGVIKRNNLSIELQPPPKKDNLARPGSVSLVVLQLECNSSGRTHSGWPPTLCWGFSWHPRLPLDPTEASGNQTEAIFGTQRTDRNRRLYVKWLKHDARRVVGSNLMPDNDFYPGIYIGWILHGMYVRDPCSVVLIVCCNCGRCAGSINF